MSYQSVEGLYVAGQVVEVMDLHDPTWRERFIAIAWNNDATENELLAALDDPNVCVRHAAAMHGNATERVWLKALSDPEWTVRETVAKRPDLTEAVMLEAMRDRHYRVRLAIAENPCSKENR